MKILHVTKKYPHALGGDAIVVANLQKQQEAVGHDIVIVTSNCEEIKVAKNVYKCGLKDTPAQLDTITVRRVVSLLMLCVKMFAILHKERPDVVHTHSVDMAFFISFAARFYHIPIVHTFHIVTFYNVEQSALRRKSELWLAKKTKPRSVTAPNVYDVEMLQDSGLTQAVLLPNGVDNEQWKTVVGKQSKRNIFVAVGRLEKQKGFTYLIKAASHLAGMRPTQVVIVGEGSQKATLQALIHRLHLEDVVILAGRKTPEEISKLLGKAYAAVFPSLYETTPLTLLEAWASGTPTIATPVGILRDVPVDFEAALIVPLKNERAFAAAMQQCMVDAQLRTKMAMAGYEEVKKYKWPTIARTAEEIYRSAT